MSSIALPWLGELIDAFHLSWTDISNLVKVYGTVYRQALVDHACSSCCEQYGQALKTSVCVVHNSAGYIGFAYALAANHLPASSGTTTRDFMCFFIFWLISLPAIWLPLHKVRHLFTVKAIIVPIAGVIFFVWCIVKANGMGPIIRQPGTLHGSKLAWTMISSMMTCISNSSTLITCVSLT